jgi:pimeloyl-ACP methyl ester carboxylesterase
MRRAYVDISEGQVHYRTGGRGDNILLLHKTSMSSMEYSKIMPTLAESYRVVAMDTLAYGESDKPPMGYNIEDYARSVVNFLNVLGIKKTNIIGHLTGAAIAVEVAALHPELLEKLVLVSCPYYDPEVRKARLSDHTFGIEEIREDGSHLIDIWNRYRKIAPQAKAENLQRTILGHLMAGPRSHDGHLAVFRYNIEKRLPLIKSPTLLIYDTVGDQFHSRIEATKRLIPDCYVKIIEGGADLIPLERPDEFIQAILDFMK